MIKKLDNKLNNVPKAEPRSLLSSNNDVNRGSALGVRGIIFEKEAIQSFEDLGDILKEIHLRLIKDGYVLKDGAFIKKDNETRINK